MTHEQIQNRQFNINQSIDLIRLDVNRITELNEGKNNAETKRRAEYIEEEAQAIVRICEEIERATENP
jgi:hypothetical protein